MSDATTTDDPPVPGQRWVSDAEPELGLGIVHRLAARRLLLHFPASGAEREYALGSAPLRRVRFRPGDVINPRKGGPFTIATVRETDGLITYLDAKDHALPEGELADTTSFSTPDERLLSGHVDPTRLFDLRLQALDAEHRRRQLSVRGFVGGRIQLIPHQLYIAGEVTSRHAPRVLLADEVGLGKAIEACLIVHRLLETGRASRVLIVVPEALVHQWFIELLRRFNLRFKIFEEWRWRKEDGRPVSHNPFEEEALVLCALPLLADARRARDASSVDWDVLVVDEAHHLRWAHGKPSAEYSVVEVLARRAHAVLLLTATPEQLGIEGHFARLRLLDPSRYVDFAAFTAEVEHYREVARLASALLDERALGRADRSRLAAILGGESGPARERLSALARGDAHAPQDLVADLIDRHGPGRAIFRNTRAVVKGFPRRHLRAAPLELPPEREDVRARLAEELAADIGLQRTQPAPDYTDDPRLPWLAALLRRLRGAKVLLICRTRAKVIALASALERHSNVHAALFHEGLDLLQRDRQAAWFAEEDGPPVLLASEIGSEGRNFQFAHHLVLFDLPADPELLEQRIGRLDRIGQTETIQIHVPYVEDGPHEVLFRWYHEGLDAFAHHLHLGRELLETLGERVRPVATAFCERGRNRQRMLEALVRDTHAARVAQERELAHSRDRLLELGSFRTAPAAALVETIRALDAEPDLDRLMQLLWSRYGVSVDDLAPRTYRLGAERNFVEAFPGVPAEGLTVTLDRARALAREDVAFLTWDHPMVTGALDLLLGSRDGNASIAALTEDTARGLWLDAVFVLEPVAPPALHTDRFLAPTPLRVIVDARGNAITTDAVPRLGSARLQDVAASVLREHTALDRPRLRRLVAAALAHAAAQQGALVSTAVATMERQLGHEIDRQRALAAVNPSVRPAEIQALEREREALRTALRAARIRLDAARVILLGPAR